MPGGAIHFASGAPAKMVGARFWARAPSGTATTREMATAMDAARRRRREGRIAATCRCTRTDARAATWCHPCQGVRRCGEVVKWFSGDPSSHHATEPSNRRTIEPPRRMCRLFTSNILVRSWTLGASLLLVPALVAAQDGTQAPRDHAV